jgi:Holliday junction resolvase RusA-like endonuclease
MKDQFYLSFDTMPKGTAQQKRYNGRTGHYFKSKTLVETEKIFHHALYSHRPKKPSELPVKVCLRFYFDVKDKKKWGLPKTTMPDVDNFCKAFLDQMTQCGFWEDDAQVYKLVAEKYYAEKAAITVIWEEVTDG